MEIEINKFIEKYKIDDEGKKDLINLLNVSLLKISEEIVNRKSEGNKVKKVENQKYASKKAEQFAIENEIDIKEFKIEKVTKKDVEELVRKKTKEGKKEKIEIEVNDNKNTGTINKEEKKKVLLFLKRILLYVKK